MSNVSKKYRERKRDDFTYLGSDWRRFLLVVRGRENVFDVAGHDGPTLKEEAFVHAQELFKVYR